MLAVTNSSTGSPASDWQPALENHGVSSSAQLSGACILLAVMIESQSTTQSGARQDIELNHDRMEALKKELADAIQAAKDAADSGGFFGFLGDVFGSDIAQIAGAVAAVAATIATGGAAAPLLAIAIAEALQVAAKVGPELGLPKEVCIGLAIASVAVGFCSGVGAANAAGEIADTARTVSSVAKIVQGGATVIGGVGEGVAGYYRGQQLGHQADAVGIKGQSEDADMEIDDAIALLSRALRVQQQQTGTVTEIIDNNEAANTALCDRI